MSKSYPATSEVMSELATKAQLAITEAVSRQGARAVAEEFDVTTKTIGRWQEGSIRNPGLILHAVNNLMAVGESEDKYKDGRLFSFIDLFAGIGGTRIGFERAGGNCVFTSEWDKFAQVTYRANHHLDHSLEGDIWKVPLQNIPEHDILVAGFPCQPFSIAGVSKKNSLGRAHGFEDETQGTLFHRIAEIIDAKKPAAFLLENVKNLQTHDRGKTFRVIQGRLRELDYHFSSAIIDGRVYTPQHRERIYIVGFRQPTAFDWKQVNLDDPRLKVGSTMRDILHPEDSSEEPEKDYTIGAKAAVNPKYVLSQKLWKYLQDYADKHKAKGNGFGFGKVEPEDTCRTLSARYYKDGSEILVSRGKNARPRRLTPRECARLMGFPENFQIPVSDTQAYKQFGNSVVVPVVESIAKAMAPHVVSLVNQQEKQDQYSMVV